MIALILLIVKLSLTQIMILINDLWEELLLAMIDVLLIELVALELAALIPSDNDVEHLVGDLLEELGLC